MAFKMAIESEKDPERLLTWAEELVQSEGRVIEYRDMRGEMVLMAGRVIRDQNRIQQLLADPKVKCQHDSSIVHKDLLYDEYEVGIQWCSGCGAYRRFIKPHGSWDERIEFQEWIEPRATKASVEAASRPTGAGAREMKQAPWTDDEVDALNAFQQRRDRHPFTCGGNRTDAAHKQYQAEHGGDFGQLVATNNGWICPVCGYRQDWAHEIMTHGGGV